MPLQIFGSNRSAVIAALDRFLVEASVAHKWRILNDLEGSMTRQLGRAFRAQRAKFMAGFAGLRSGFVEARPNPPASFPEAEGGARLRETLTVGDWLRIFDEATGSTFDLFFEPLRAGIEMSLLAGAAEAINSIGIDYAFGLRNPRAVAYLDAHGATLISQINEVTRGNIQTLILEGVNEGWSYNRIARAITQMYGEMAVGRPQQHIDSRAHLIAVTELGNAYEEGNAIVVRDLADAGLQMEKSWLTVGDERVSSGCRSNQAEGWIPLAQSFSSGQQRPLRFPGCRCTALYRRKP